MSEYALTMRAQYCNLTDEELDEIVADIQTQFSVCDNRQMHGHLVSSIASENHMQRRVESVDPY